MRRLAVGLAAAATLATSEAVASGFAIREQSASFQGAAFAGVAAGGDDISTMFFNPATLTLHDGSQVHLSTSYVVPSAEFELESAGDGSGNVVAGGAGGDIADDAVVPALYAATRIGDVHLGLGVTAPFGLRTDQPEDWAGRYFATESDLVTININPAVAYEIAPGLSVAAGFVAQYADATLAHASDLSGGGAPPDPATDGIATAEGHDWDYGFTLGVLAVPREGTRLGLGYRSQINHSLAGDFTLTSDVMATMRDTARAAIVTPQIATLGVRQRITAAFDLLGTVEWTGWSSFDELVVRRGSGGASRTEENWNDTWFVAIGGEYRPRPGLALTAGAAYDQSPIDDDFRTPRIPGNDRTWLSIGAAWTPRPWLSLGGGYSRIFVADGEVDLDEGSTDAGGRGSLRGTFDNGVDIFAIHGSLRF